MEQLERRIFHPRNLVEAVTVQSDDIATDVGMSSRREIHDGDDNRQEFGDLSYETLLFTERLLRAFALGDVSLRSGTSCGIRTNRRVGSFARGTSRFRVSGDLQDTDHFHRVLRDPSACTERA